MVRIDARSVVAEMHYYFTEYVLIFVREVVGNPVGRIYCAIDHGICVDTFSVEKPTDMRASLDRLSCCFLSLEKGGKGVSRLTMKDRSARVYKIGLHYRFGL